MTTFGIAEKLANYCRQNEFHTAINELFAEDAVSIEPRPTPGFEQSTSGLQALIEKNQKFGEMVEETYNIVVSDPLVTTNVIAFVLTMDISMKKGGRQKLEELCVYEVRGGKIISEQFFM